MDRLVKAALVNELFSLMADAGVTELLEEEDPF